MNSLNLLSARVIGSSSSEKPQANRKRSYSEGNLNNLNSENTLKRSSSQHVKRVVPQDEIFAGSTNQSDRSGWDGSSANEKDSEELDEKEPLIKATKDSPNSRHGRFRVATRRLIDVLTASLKWALSTLAAPALYIVMGFYDEKGRFSPSTPFRKLSRITSRHNGDRSTAKAAGFSKSQSNTKSSSRQETNQKGTRRSVRQKYLSTTKAGSEDDQDEKSLLLDRPSASKPVLQSSSSSEEVPQMRRSIRIKAHNEETTRRRKNNRDREAQIKSEDSSYQSKSPSLTVADIKSPTSPAASLRMAKYPHSPSPPRPLIPPRQPSYSSQPTRDSRFAQKTLVIDLDETLIHSLAKGGRMSSGHMVEVKLNTTVGIGGATLGPQHPILYYVHKRPHCDEFLKRVCKWYNLVVFTASVQEYADPVIDWLEQERKYFSNRFYRQHCTFRNGAYIKDLSSVEPDLRKVMILDNSPLSYIFHEDNAIPIEGWINDPTDNDLLHLVPILEALQYVTDVRALLALRRGETNALQ